MADKTTQQIKEVKAFARYVHVSPRKLRLVADMIRNTSIDVALEQLRFSSKNAALPLSKAINSAIANATHNFNINRENLYVKAVTIDGGPVFKRYAPRAQGRAFVERKRTSHINVVLGTRHQVARKRLSILPKAQAPTKLHAHDSQSGQVAAKPAGPKQAPKTDEKMKQQKISLKRRLFNRKSGE